LHAKKFPSKQSRNSNPDHWIEHWTIPLFLILFYFLKHWSDKESFRCVPICYLYFSFSIEPGIGFTMALTPFSSSIAQNIQTHDLLSLTTNVHTESYVFKLDSNLFKVATSTNLNNKQKRFQKTKLHHLWTSWSTLPINLESLFAAEFVGLSEAIKEAARLLSMRYVTPFGRSRKVREVHYFSRIKLLWWWFPEEEIDNLKVIHSEQ